ncbi:MAG: type II toxin-antitoxin system HicA family toxin [Candidatus Tectomicrobia bacterium]|uniref:Type II toxin-antitoxin system HicA family toxin n=1 Tax=Tectimicrobiota bacterium TaxID=2528274 RepID=A0A933GKI3_UNCTE|nr:type II toxin-antitoxin system HicA family toxin [Candidatus Tectomicrobia bacterium]
MEIWKPCKRRVFIKKLRKFGFDPPEPGGRHFYMRYDRYTLTLPSNREYSVAQVKMLLNEIELGIGKRISFEEWEDL